MRVKIGCSCCSSSDEGSMPLNKTDRWRSDRQTDWQTVRYEDKERETGRQAGRETDRHSLGWCICISPSSSAGFDSVWSSPFLRWVLLTLVRLFSRSFFFFPELSGKDVFNLPYLLYRQRKDKYSSFPFFPPLIIRWNPLPVSIFPYFKVSFDIRLVRTNVKEIDILDL